MEPLFTYLSETLNIDIVIVLIVFLSGFFQDRFFHARLLFHDQRTDEAVKTLLVSFLVAFIWIYLRHKQTHEPVAYDKYFISYFAATSIYELAIRPFRKALNKLLRNEDPK